MTPQRIPPELLATTPPTVAISVLAGSGPSLRPCGARTRLAWPSTVPGLTRAIAPPSSTATPAEVAAHVDQDPVTLPLAVEAGPAGAEGDRDAGAAAVGEDLGDIARCRGPPRRPAGGGGRGWRRRRSGRCRSPGPTPGRRRAAPQARPAGAAPRRRRSDPGRGRRRALPPRGASEETLRSNSAIAPSRKAPSRAPRGLRPALGPRRRAPSPARRAPPRAR